MRMTREERHFRNVVKCSRAVQVRWDLEHAMMRELGITPVYDQHHAYGPYEITIKSLRSGKVNVLYLGEGGTRRDNFDALLNGKPWEPRIASISDVTKFVRKSIVKTRSGRIV